MDPNTCLQACRRLAARILKDADSRNQHHESTMVDTQGEELAECFNNLDEWIGKGGFLPADWRAT